MRKEGLGGGRGGSGEGSGSGGGCGGGSGGSGGGPGKGAASVVAEREQEAEQEAEQQGKGKPQVALTMARTQIATNQHFENQDLISALQENMGFYLEPHIWSHLNWRDLMSASGVSKRCVTFQV